MSLVLDRRKPSRRGSRLAVNPVLLLLLSLLLGACSDGTNLPPAPEPLRDMDAAQMEAELSEVLGTSDPLDRLAAFVPLMQSLDMDNVDGAIAAFKPNMHLVKDYEVEMFGNAWARFDPKAAVNSAVIWDNVRMTRGVIFGAVYYWTAHGGDEEARLYALSTIEGSANDSQTNRNTAIDATVQGLAFARKHETLNKLLSSFPDDRGRGWLVTKASLELIQQGFPALRAWADSIPWDAPNDLKMKVLRVAFELRAKKDGKDAAAWYAEHQDKIGEQAENPILQPVLLAWAYEEPEAAIEWGIGLNPTPERRPALQAVAYQWLKKSPKQAAEWIEAHLDDPVVDSAMRFPLAQYLIAIDIHRALPIAEKLSDEKNEKVRAMKQILVLWVRTDPQAVYRYIEENDVPREVIETVRGQEALGGRKVIPPAKTNGASS